MEYGRKLTDYYELGDEIGEGGFGAVLAGTCKTTGNLVSVCFGQSTVVVAIVFFG